jgi:hypothetical protein
MNTTELLQTLAKGLDEALAKAVPGKRTCFSLLIWQDGEVNYVSNSNRKDVHKALKEVLDRWDTPGYKRQ